MRHRGNKAIYEVKEAIRPSIKRKIMNHLEIKAKVAPFLRRTDGGDGRTDERMDRLTDGQADEPKEKPYC